MSSIPFSYPSGHLALWYGQYGGVFKQHISQTETYWSRYEIESYPWLTVELIKYIDYIIERWTAMSEYRNVASERIFQLVDFSKPFHYY